MSKTTAKERNPAQQEFDEKYITSTEITRRLRITRSSLMDARKRGKLKHPIYVQGQIYIWLRAEVEPFLRSWKMVLDARRASIA